MKGHLINERLLGVAVYNPGILSKDELIRLFVARRHLLQQIIDDLRREKINGIPQHRLLVGARGMGKSTLLHRISYAVEDDPALSAGWIPLTFPEEQYNVARLSDLWLNCLDALSDALERSGKHDEAQALDDIIDALPGKDEEERSRKALGALLEHAQRMGKRLLLLIDNVDLVLDRLAKEHWTIREMLAKEGAPLLIGATSRPLEPTYVYEGAFYDFFKIDNLNKLQLEEMHVVLQTLSAELNAPQVAELLKSDPARIRVLYDLTGGNPRTTVLLFGVLAQGIDGDVRTDLERLLDQCTPLYKARFEELSNQAQQVVDALALHWDPATAAAVAEKAHLDVNSVSSHLNRLSEQGVVEKVRLYPKKKTGFQLSERFFNIWYLMRASRRMRRKLIWLSKFLKSFYRQDDLHRLAHRYLQKEAGVDGYALVKHAEYGFALAEALDDHGWRRALEHTASRITLDIQRQFRDAIGDSAIGLDELDNSTLTMSQVKERILTANVNWDGIDKEEFCELLCGGPFSLFVKSRLAERVERIPEELVSELFVALSNSKKRIEKAYGNIEIINLLFKAISAGLMDSSQDVEGAASAVHVFNEPALLTLALGERLLEEPDQASIEVFKRHLEDVRPAVPQFWLQLAEAQLDMDLSDAAERTYRRALDLFPESTEILVSFGSFLRCSNKAEEALPFLETAVMMSPDDSTPRIELAVVLMQLQRIGEAERSFRRAIEIDPSRGTAWCGLGAIEAITHKDVATSDGYFSKAIALSPEDPDVLAIWAATLQSTFRYPEAEQAFRRLLQVDQENKIIELGLATVLLLNGKFTEAEVAVTSSLKGISEQQFRNFLTDIFAFCKAAVTTCHAKEALNVLEQAELTEPWRPLIEALRAVVAGTTEYFLNVAPEIRNAAEKIYNDLTTDEQLPSL